MHAPEGSGGGKLRSHSHCADGMICLLFVRKATAPGGAAVNHRPTPTADQVISHFHTCETMRILVNPRETVRNCAKRRVKLCEIHVKFHVKVAQSPVKVTRKRNKRRETCEIRVKLRSRAKPREAARNARERARTRAKARETRAKRARNARNHARNGAKRCRKCDIYPGRP